MTDLEPGTKINQKRTETDDKIHEQRMSSQLEQYHLLGIETKKELDRIYDSIDQFKMDLDTHFEFKIQNKPFKIRQVVSYSSNTKQKKDPVIWHIETVSPGSPRMVYESLSTPKYREEWDTYFASSRKIQIEDGFPNIYIFQSCSRIGAGGLISPRDFVEMVSIHEFTNEATGYQSVQSASKSVEREDIPKQKGFVRGNVVIGGMLFERLSDKEMDEMELPKLMVPVNEDMTFDIKEKENTKECEWTRIRYILQTDIKGWIPATIVNAAMSRAMNGVISDLREFVIRKRLGLINECQVLQQEDTL